MVLYFDKIEFWIELLWYRPHFVSPLTCRCAAVILNHLVPYLGKIVFLFSLYDQLVFSL